MTAAVFLKPKKAFTQVMQSAYRHLKLHPEDNDDVQSLRIMCIRRFVILSREQGDIEASYKWIAAGKNIASRYLSEIKDARYWNHCILIEQRINDEYVAEKERHDALKRRILVSVSVTVAVLAILLAVLLYMYLTLRSTFRYLAKKNEDDATELLSKPDPDSINDGNSTLAAMLVSYMADTKAYLNPDLCLNDLCRDLCTNRTYMSNVFSRMGTNFNAFVNRYRVSEAIKLLSKNPECSLGDIWSACGFNSQSTFYSSFKTLTGLTPAQFKSSMN